MATLHVLQGPDKGRTLQTHDDVVLLGRGSAQVPLTDRTISRRHAELRLEDGAWIISDANSANGTYVNGIRITRPTRLKHGDQIRVGGTLLLYSGGESLEQFSGGGIPRDLISLDAGAEVDAAVVASVPSNEDSVVLAAPDTAYAVRSWKAMSDLLQAIGNLLDPEQLLARVMDILFEEVECDRGAIFIRDDHSGELLPEVIRYRSRAPRGTAPPARDAILASRTIMTHVVESREGVLCSNVVNDKRFEAGKSIQDLGMRSVICAPIVARERVLGVIHVDNPVGRHTYNEHELRLVTAIGYQTGLAIENARLVKAALERERLAAAGETVAYLSHAIKNILQGMRSGSDVMKRGLGKHDLNLTEQGWRILDRNLDKCYALMLNMLAFSKQREPQLAACQLNRIAADVVNLAQNQADDAGIVLLSDFEDSLPEVPADYDGVHQILLNLVVNAIDVVERGSGVVTVRTRFDHVDRHAVVIVKDNGPGVGEDNRARIFEPFFSTKGHRGTGLGLAVSRKIAAELGGELRLDHPDDGGAEFHLRLPTADVRSEGPGETQAPPRSPRP